MPYPAHNLTLYWKLPPMVRKFIEAAVMEMPEVGEQAPHNSPSHLRSRNCPHCISEAIGEVLPEPKKRRPKVWYVRYTTYEMTTQIIDGRPILTYHYGAEEVRGKGKRGRK